MRTQKIILDQGLKIYLGIVTYFLLMKLFSLEEIVELRVLNFGIVLWGVNSTIKKNVLQNLDNSYLTNLSIGFATAAFSVILTTISLLIYVSFIEPNFMTILESSFVWGKNLSLPLITFAILIEGMASSVICSFLMMQYWKKHKVTTDQGMFY